ncbi:type I polyketide synthase [Mycobacterium heidelbergense]|uniref:Polyketide synthase n=1 Tax=Mycobacterium heidelbergense TaxID=53376 RepID=A0A1X0D4M9_MYCHE|nr:type I polyketide synthase [Mycobacterium heidelbergense]MCV7050424.1 type I polyketide synthase [Mycobacterium heidelbergense]ORA67361.1 polyketide synthase [Mycobacterium heidelbergense]BBZ52782.1 polyketide synthase [Mycobacterium heidelbergense]
MQSTAIAVIGLACRFPGAASPHEFWRLIHDGVEVTRLGADVAEFDADFFNVSPREARAMDPRQRLALELTWELCEDAFVVPETLRGEQVSVYLGAMNDDYAVLTLGDTAEGLDHHSFAGISRAMIANRISYAFGLHGSSLTVDSGQSSSLVAVHLACESLRTGESALAIAGGVHLNLAGETAMLEREFGAVSTSGHTYAFDGRADGYVRSQGGGLVLLKPLPAALDDGNRIRAIIRGSAVGNAGHRAAGQTVPAVAAQADVIRRALAGAGLDAGQLEYIEAHGAGTKIGDPVEAKALGEVFAGRRHRPVSLGSVKTNIGHAGSAAGIAGLLKTVLAIENAVIPPSLNYAAPSPGIDLEGLGLRVATTPAPWPVGGPRRAGVSSFGMGGTNAHVIVEEAPAEPKASAAQGNASPTAWVLSGRSQRALANQAARLLAHLADDPEVGVADVAWSLATTRAVFEHRAVLVGPDRENLAAGLAGLASAEPRPNVVLGRARSPGKTVFVFPGQGAQWPGMGARLYGDFPAFARAFDEAATALEAHLRLPLPDVMWGGDATLLGDTEFAQPALFAIEVALTALLGDWGVTPDLVMGHSVGEITAAHVAGVLSLADAAEVVARRGRLMAGLPPGGAMVAVAASEADVAPLLTGGVTIAAVNGPDAVVISGAEAPVAAIAGGLAQRGRRVHRLAVSHAFHSALMEPMVEDFAAAVASVSPAEPRIALLSNVSGRQAGPGYGSARYWVEHVRRPVRFLDGVRAAESLGAGLFVEVGPGGGLSASVEQSLTTQEPVSVVTMVNDRPEADALLTAAGRLFAAGVAVRWDAALRGGRRIPLPTYGFARQRFWLNSGTDTPPALPTEPADWAERLRQLEPDEQHRQLVELVRVHAAAALGHSDTHAVDSERAFQDLGFDSMTGVELRNRLKADTGLALSRTLVFDHPTPTALAEHLRQQLLRGDHGESDEEKIWSSLRKIPIHELRRTGLLDTLLLLAGDPEKPLTDSTIGDDTIDSLSPEALIVMALESDRDDDAE